VQDRREVNQKRSLSESDRIVALYLWFCRRQIPVLMKESEIPKRIQILKEQLSKTYREINYGEEILHSDEISRMARRFREWGKGCNAIPLWALEALAVLTGKNLNDLEKHITQVCTPGQHSIIDYPKFPIKVNEEFGRLIGYYVSGIIYEKRLKRGRKYCRYYIDTSLVKERTIEDLHETINSVFGTARISKARVQAISKMIIYVIEESLEGINWNPYEMPENILRSTLDAIVSAKANERRGWISISIRKKKGLAFFKQGLQRLGVQFSCGRSPYATLKISKKEWEKFERITRAGSHPPS